MGESKKHVSIKLVNSWKIQLVSSFTLGLLFGIFHFLKTEMNLMVLATSTLISTFHMIVLWQGAILIFNFTERKYQWNLQPYKRVYLSLFLGGIYASLTVFLFNVLFNDVVNDPKATLAGLMEDWIICLIIIQLILTCLNLYYYFNILQSKKIEDAERNIESYFETLIENIHDVIQVIDKNGNVVYCSRSIESLTGFTIDEMKQFKSGFLLVHPIDRKRIENEFKQNISKGFKTYVTHHRLLSKSNELKSIETKIINALENPQLNGYILIQSDVTERVRSEEKSQHQRELYQLLTEISTQFLNSELNTALKEMLEKIGRFAKVDRTYVYLLNEEKANWDCMHEWRSISVEDVKSNYYQTGFSVNDSTWLLNEIKSNHIINFEDTDYIPEIANDFKQICKTDNTKSVLLIPMTRNGKVYGFMGYDSVITTKKWLDSDISALLICSEILISSILRSDAEKAMERSLSINKAIIESTSEGILLTDLDDNMLYYNQNFKDMWMFTDDMLKDGKKSIALNHAIKNVVNAQEVYEIISTSEENVNKRIRLIAQLKNNRVLEGISQPQVIDGKVVGRVWSNRDITDRVNAEKEEIEKSFALAQFESLKNQVNPHFLFNSLNVLSSLVHIDADLSEKFIDQLAKSYRYLLEQKDNELVLLKTEIDFVHSFTFLLQIRFEEKLQVNIHLDAQIMQYYVAPLTLQLLIENAVKHNVISAESPLIINIYNEGEENLIVSNNLQLREQQLPSTGVGLKNIKDRYKHLTQKSTQFYVENEKYIARIPLIKNMQS